MNPRHRLRITALLLTACLAGGLTAVGVASGDRGRGGDDDSTTGTTDDGTTGTTGTTGTGTTGTGTTGTGTAPSTAPRQARAPRIAEIEVDSVSGGRLRLRAELQSRGARVTRVTFVYRGRTIRARRTRGKSNEWSRVVRARGGDGNDDVIRFRVRACAGSRCAARTGSDEA
jgi:hypothetical protein